MTAPYFDQGDVVIHHGDVRHVLAQLPDESVQCVVTSPPYYGLRDYGTDPVSWPQVSFEPMAGLPPVTTPAMQCSLGLEPDPWAYVAHLRLIFAEVRRVLRPDGVAWLNLGDSYAGKANGGESFDRHRGHGHRSKQGIVPRRINTTATAPYKSLLGIPWRVAFALNGDGWTVRNDIVWAKPNAMPESVTDRLSNRYEHLFLLTKSRRYWFDLDAIKEPLRTHRATGHVFGGANKAKRLIEAGSRDGGTARRSGNTYDELPDGRNPGDVWTIPTTPYPGAHFACMPPALARRCILTGCPEGATVLDPFHGAGTTGMVARRLGRRYVGIELNSEYIDLSIDRLGQPTLDFTEAVS